MKIRIFFLMIVALMLSSSFAFAGGPDDKTESRKVAYENKVSDFVDYTVPKRYAETAFENGNGIVCESELRQGDFCISITVYENTNLNHKIIYQCLNGRKGSDTELNGLKAREGRTDLDHMVVVEDENHIIEFFASMERTCFTGRTFGISEEQEFDKFLKKVRIK